MENSPATLQKILGILEKTDTFFEKTQLINNHLLDQMDSEAVHMALSRYRTKRQ